MTFTKNFDLTLYAIADASIMSIQSAPSLVENAIAGGVTAFQIRAKNLSHSEFLLFAEAVLAATSPHDVRVIINDDVEIALATEADGVHLGADDVPIAEARRTLGDLALIGATAHSMKELKAAAKAGADYIGFGSIYPSPSKKVEAIQGPAGIRKARAVTSLPLIAIGGITVGRAAEVIGAGADGVAVISGLWSAGDVESRAREYRAEINRGFRIR